MTELDEVYADRNRLAQLAAVLASRLGYEISIGLDEHEPAYPVLYIQLPTGQISWHIKVADLTLLDIDHVSWPAVNPWDGHDDREKKDRIEFYCKYG